MLLGRDAATNRRISGPGDFLHHLDEGYECRLWA